MRRLIAFLGVVLTGAVATACAPPFGTTCPAIGYITKLQVDATGIPDATWVQLCSSDNCSPAPGTTGSESTVIGATEREAVWSFSFLDNSAPGTVTIRVTDAAGSILQEREHRIDWTHATDPCGGPSSADPVVLVS